MKSFLFFLLCLWTWQGIAQTKNQTDNCFETMFKEGMDDYNKKEYYHAYLNFRAARYGCKLKDKTQEDKADYWMNEANSQYANALKIALNAAEREKENAKREQHKSDSLLQVAKDALQRADENQKAMELACFKKGTSVKLKGSYFTDEECEKIDTLDLSDNYLERLPEDVAKCKNLKRINLLGNPIRYGDTTTFKILLQLPKLEEIELETDNIYDIPSGLYSKIISLKTSSYEQKAVNFYNLKTLCLQYCDTLPKKIARFYKLENLYLPDCKLKEFPKEVSELKKLTTLDLSGSEFEKFPKGISNFKNLKLLKFKNGSVTDSISEIGTLRTLITLDLQDTKLGNLPKEIGNLTNLKDLNLESCYLSFLPKEIGGLNNLTTLDLQSVMLDSLPKEIGKLSNLKVLILKGNSLHNLPKEIGNLGKLENLDLSSNQLISLPVEIGQLKSLTSLNLESAIDSFPKEICKIKSLQNLNLRENLFYTLSSEIGGLSNLRELNLSNTWLESLPSEIGKLSNLKYLNLESNALESLPREIGNLNNLERLEMSYNLLVSLPSEIDKLSNLKYLNLHYNTQLTLLPKEIGNLTNLRELDLSSSSLEYLPPEIGKLSNLTYIDYSETKLQSLPKEVTQLKIFDAESCGALSWRVLKNKEYEKALFFAQKGLEKDSTQTWIYAHLFFGYLFTNQYNKAKELFLVLNNKSCVECNVKFNYLLAKGIENLEELNMTHPDISKIKKLIIDNLDYNSSNAEDCGNWAWYLLKNQKYEEALCFAQKGLEKDNTEIWIYIDLSLGYLFTNQYEKAKKIFLTWKDNIDNYDRNFKQYFQECIEELEKLGITHPNMRKIKELLKD